MTSLDTSLTVLDPSEDYAYQRIIALAVDGVDSPNTKRIYRQALEEFLKWHDALGRPPLTKAHIQAYKAHLQSRGLSSSSINVKLSAVRRLIREAADNQLVDEQAAQSIARVKGVKSEGQRLGNWLDLKAAQRLLNAPDSTSLRGRRDHALLAVMLGAALRREEAANLTVEHIQQREARWVIVDLKGKRGKVRSIPVPPWVKLAVDAWTMAADVTTGPLFLAMRKGDHFFLDADDSRRQMTTTAIWKVVREYADELGIDNLAPHDLRRTAAKLMRAGGAPIEQISMVLGHSSIDVTKRYLGTELDLQDAATDRIGLKIQQ